MPDLRSAPFINDDFLLHTKVARRLYREHAAQLPIVDYHCHLNPQVLLEDQPFESITALWIGTDPYKHRAMRLAGIPERFISGEATPREKFNAWASVVPLTLGNPLFHWNALELKRYFGVDTLLDSASAEDIWQHAEGRLKTPALRPRSLLAQARCELVCTSDRLLDSLDAHAALARDPGATTVWPSLRGDDLLAIGSPDYRGWLQQLAHVTGTAIDSYEAFQHAVRQRLDHFASLGCRLADHGIDVFRYRPTDGNETAIAFGKLIRGHTLDGAECVDLQSSVLFFAAREYARRGWVLQLHIGAQRETSTRLRGLAGLAGGYAAIGGACDIPSLCRFFDHLESEDCLPRIILYPLNPSDNVAIATLTGSFSEDGVPGKLQFGPAWWYNDHAFGIRAQLEVLSSYGLLSTFVGMTTDARSLLSMVRHEYFRRILCDFIGDKVTRGELPADEALLNQYVRSICYGNAHRVFSGEVIHA